MGTLKDLRWVLSEPAGELVSLGLGETWYFRVKTGLGCVEIRTFLAWLIGRDVETAVVVALPMPVVLGGCGVIGIRELGEFRTSSSSSSV